MNAPRGIFRCLLLAVGMTVALAVSAAATPLATWDALVPTAKAYHDPFVDMPLAQKEDLRLILRADAAASNGQQDPDLTRAAEEARQRIEQAGLDVAYLFEQRDLIIRQRTEAALGVTTAYLDQSVMMDGYALPLRVEAGRVVEFFLVPWLGACIHTPAPPANQIVHVEYPNGFEAVSMFTPIRLNGKLVHEQAEHRLFLVDGTRQIQASYAMQDAVIGGAPGAIVATATVPGDLSWFARTQARITNTFTSAMSDMEQGRSAGTVVIALLIAFAYGALHTLGPGHGKAVVISYFIGAGGSLRRGVVMGTRIAVMHVLSALVVVFALDFAVRQTTGAAPSDYRLIRLASYAMISAIGAFMVWSALSAIFAERKKASGGGNRPDGQPYGGHHDSHHHHIAGHAHTGCAACAAAQTTTRGGGWIAAAVGVVPCTGALIVMLFGLANDLILPAVMMVIAISAGMALAMSGIGVAALWGRDWAETRWASDARRRMRFGRWTQMSGAVCVFAIGVGLFTLTVMHPSGPEQTPTEITLHVKAGMDADG